MADALDQLLTTERLRDFAGKVMFERGAEYADEGAVGPLARELDLVRAEVQGSVLYEVELGVEDGELVASCTCPVGDDDRVCKHVVALGLVAIRDRADPAATRSPHSVVGRAALASALARLPADDLAALLADAAMHDAGLRSRLEVRLRSSQPAGPDVAEIAREIRRVTRPRSFVEWRAAPAAARSVDDLIDEVERLLPAHAAAVRDLCERLVEGLEALLERMDDSDGRIRPLRERTEALHLRACEAAPPDPAALAKLLYTSHMESEIEAFHGAVARYARILGPTGLAAFRRLVEPAWKALDRKPRRDAITAEAASAWLHGFRVRSAMEALARAEGDVDELVRVIARDADSAYDAVRIVEAYAGAGRTDEALAAAERGLDEARRDPRGRAESPDERALEDFVVARYAERGRALDAVAVRWTTFARAPSRPAYARLVATAEAAGVRAAWRDKALALVRSRAEAPPAVPRGGRRGPHAEERAPRDLWVGILLDEGDADGAWDVARAGPCGEEALVEVAERRSRTHPVELARLLRPAVARAIERRSPRSYEEAATILRRIRTLCVAGRRPEEFRQFLEEVRTTHRAKRSLMAILDRRL